MYLVDFCLLILRAHLMQAAFFFTAVFPPPTAGPEILAWPDRARARRTANADKAPVVQGIIGNFVLRDIVFYLVG